MVVRTVKSADTEGQITLPVKDSRQFGAQITEVSMPKEFTGYDGITIRGDVRFVDPTHENADVTAQVIEESARQIVGDSGKLAALSPKKEGEERVYAEVRLGIKADGDTESPEITGKVDFFRAGVKQGTAAVIGKMSKDAGRNNAGGLSASEFEDGRTTRDMVAGLKAHEVVEGVRADASPRTYTRVVDEYREMHRRLGH